MTESCTGCAGIFKKSEGPTHPYVESSPGCWAAFGEVLACEYENYPQLENAHRLTVDTYCVQHPGRPSRKSTQSVHAHLLVLHSILEEGLPAALAKARMVAFVESRPDLEWLKPPNFLGTPTVSDVLAAQDPAEHTERVSEWAQSVWNRWKALHGDRIGRNSRLVATTRR